MVRSTVKIKHRFSYKDPVSIGDRVTIVCDNGNTAEGDIIATRNGDPQKYVLHFEFHNQKLEIIEDEIWILIPKRR